MDDKKQENCTHHGQNIEFWRLFNRWTQQQLGDMLAMTQNNISTLEKKEVIDDETLSKMANALGVDVAHLKECNHQNTLNTCKSVINYIYNVQSGAEFINTMEIGTQVNNPLDKITELYERIIDLTREMEALKHK